MWPWVGLKSRHCVRNCVQSLWQDRRKQSDKGGLKEGGEARGRERAREKTVGIPQRNSSATKRQRCFPNCKCFWLMWGKCRAETGEEEKRGKGEEYRSENNTDLIGLSTCRCRAFGGQTALHIVASPCRAHGALLCAV